MHDDLPDVGVKWPDHYFDVPENERDLRIDGNSNICKIDNQLCFIRGVIYIPIINSEKHFGLGVWVSQKSENYETYLANYDTDQIGPFFGWLCNNISFYDEDTQLLKTMAHFRGHNNRPRIELEPSEHQLFQDFSQGVTLDKAFEYVHAIS